MDKKELVPSGSQKDKVNLCSATRQAISAAFYKATAADGRCQVEGCLFISAKRRKIQEHTEGHFVVYAVNCGYLTSRRDSASKHIKNIHNQSGTITQLDEQSWKAYSRRDSRLPQDIPALPVDVSLLPKLCNSAVNTTTRPAKPHKRTKPTVADKLKDSQPMSDRTNTLQDMSNLTVSVRRIQAPMYEDISSDEGTSNTSRTVSQTDDSIDIGPIPEVEESPMVIVEQKISLRRQYAHRARDVKTCDGIIRDMRRMRRVALSDMTRIKGQLAGLTSKSVKRKASKATQ